MRVGLVCQILATCATSTVVAGVLVPGPAQGAAAAEPDTPAVNATAYRTVDLGTISGQTSEARALNEHALVVGHSDSADGSTLAVVWRDGVPEALDRLPGGRRSYAVDVNNSAMVAGASETAAGRSHAVVWSDTGVTDLGTLGGDTSYATGINDLGQVVGVSQIVGGDTHGFLWDGGQLTDIGEITPGDINNRGQVACRIRVAYGVYHACRWWAGAIVDLGGLDGAAWGINDTGDILGTALAQCSPAPPHGILWRNGIPTDLGAFGGQCYATIARGLNDQSDVVGNSQRGPGANFPPFLWHGGTMTDLTTQGLTLTDQAIAINNSGVIAGIHARHAALFIPVG